MVKSFVARFSESFRLPLKDALFLGFCAVFAVLVRIVLSPASEHFRPRHDY